MLKIKGSHTAMKSGMLAAEGIDELAQGHAQTEATTFQTRFESSWLYDELHRSRNVGPALHKLGVLGGSGYAFTDQFFAGNQPWTLTDPTPDYAT